MTFEFVQKTGRALALTSALVAAVSLSAAPSIAYAHDGGWRGEGWHHHSGHWGPGIGLGLAAGALAGAAIASSPYYYGYPYGYPSYSYAPYGYGYPSYSYAPYGYYNGY